MLWFGLNRRIEVTDSRVEQSPEGEGRSDGKPIWGADGMAHCFGGCDDRQRLGSVEGTSQRQEGNGAGDSVRLHGRNKASKGEPQERIRHETRPAGLGRTKTS